MRRSELNSDENRERLLPSLHYLSLTRNTLTSSLIKTRYVVTMSDPLNPFGNSPHSAFDPSSSVSQPTTQSQQYPTGGTGNGWGGETRSGMVPRGARTVDERRRTETDEDDYGVRPGGGEASTATPSRPPAAAQEGFVRIRILGIDRNRRDMYIKFNAEVSTTTP